MEFICYPKCSTCQKAKKWLDENKIEYTERHIVDDNPTYDELKKWYGRSGLPLKRFFNTSGMLYKEMKLKDKLPDMSEDEQLQLLATNGMLVKRPLVVAEGFMLTGFKEKEWTEKMLQQERPRGEKMKKIDVNNSWEMHRVGDDDDVIIKRAVL